MKTVCPNCHERIAKAVVEHNLQCPHCDKHPRPSLEKPSEFPSDDQVCGSCEQSLADVQHARLWDAKFYCLRCLNRHHPDLFELAQHGALRETIPYEPKEIARRAFRFSMKVVFGFAMLLAALTANNDLRVALVVFFAVMLLLGLPIAYMFGKIHHYAYAKLRPVITVKDGKLFVHISSHIAVIPLDECVWFESKAWEITVFKSGLFVPGRAIIVRVPRSYRLFRGHQLGVGFTEPTRELWKAFFELTGLPEKQKTPWWHGFDV